ncbi:MAG: hypothetical protein ABJG47_12465 [Ekhidna sp.]
MKMTRKIVHIIMLFAFSVSISFAQSIDEERMERDLKVAENIINTLSSNDGRRGLFSNIESNYMEGYGVIFNLPRSRYIYATTVKGTSVYSSQGIAYISSDDDDDEDDEVVAVAEENERRKLREEQDRKAQKAKEDYEEQKKKSEEEFKNQIIVFLVDYADLIGQLKPSDKIVVQSNGNNGSLYFSGRQSRSENKQNAFSAQILKSDLIAYKSGKTNRDATIKKIAFTSDENNEMSKDLELFSTIFARLYEPDLSSTYYISSRSIGYTNLEGYGVTFNMKVYSSSNNDGLHTIRTTGEGGLTQEERNDKVNAMYPDFEKSFKENLLDYGRTIKSLESDENVVFRVKLTECKGCDMPKEIEVAVKMKTLQSFDKGSISREEALKQISVKRK